MSRIVTISDAHLLDLEHRDAAIFTSLLASEAQRADTIVLNGDTFDFFVGRQRRAMAHYAPIIEAIEAAARKTELVLLQGNHDFHLRAVFSDAIYVGETWQTDVNGRSHVWTHGDRLVPSKQYQLLRSTLNSQAVRLITEAFPPALAWRLALLWSTTSRDHSVDTDDATMDQIWPNVQQVFAEGADVLITGHNHYCYRRDDSAGKTWWGLGPWMIDHWYLVTEYGQSEHVQAGS